MAPRQRPQQYSAPSLWTGGGIQDVLSLVQVASSPPGRGSSYHMGLGLAMVPLLECSRVAGAVAGSSLRTKVGGDRLGSHLVADLRTKKSVRSAQSKRRMAVFLRRSLTEAPKQLGSSEQVRGICGTFHWLHRGLILQEAVWHLPGRRKSCVKRVKDGMRGGDEGETSFGDRAWFRITQYSTRATKRMPAAI